MSINWISSYHLLKYVIVSSHISSMISLLPMEMNGSKAIRDKIETAGKAMLKDMAENPETITLECGVVLHPLEAGPEGFGKGVRPTAASTVKVHYHGD